MLLHFRKWFLLVCRAYNRDSVLSALIRWKNHFYKVRIEFIYELIFGVLIILIAIKNPLDVYRSLPDNQNNVIEIFLKEQDKETVIILVLSSGAIHRYYILFIIYRVLQKWLVFKRIFPTHCMKTNIKRFRNTSFSSYKHFLFILYVFVSDNIFCIDVSWIILLFAF